MSRVKLLYMDVRRDELKTFRPIAISVIFKLYDDGEGKYK